MIRLEAPLYHIPAPADSSVSREIPFGDLQKPTNFIPEVISADGSVDVPVSISVNTHQLEVADFNHEADRQMNFSPPRKPSVVHNISANGPMLPLHTRKMRLFRWQQTPTPTHPAEASGCTMEPEITDCGNASPPSPDLDQREQSVADSMWANAPMPPPSPQTRRTQQQQPFSVCQRQHTPTSTPFEASGCTAPTEIIDYGDLPPSPSAPPSQTRRAPHQQLLSICQRTATSTPIEASGCAARTEREQSVADSIWANAPMPPPKPRTRTASPKRPSSIFQQERTTSIEPSGCTARTEIIDRGNLPSPPPDLEQSVADSMWANTPMPPSPTRATSRHRQLSQNSGVFHGNTTKWASTASAARNE
ncbi:hypothetical protein PILCRDRAFT_289329 [Piloderma croceum F 1598]|uniref:Uncharacterized protein n=1 Tax=Piloderma croceum (strain F 1598) TaxID=765440 RepID=A0A0C3G7E7_PILCF|nr:hypothetical protein PILCRDRAFT_289329 [Piloderma croceum F 1598]